MTPRSLEVTRGDRATAWGLLAPGTLWLVLFFAVPVLIMAGYSVMERGTYGGVEPGFTLDFFFQACLQYAGAQHASIGHY